ncbi:glutathione hydrolase 1 proenzyme-like [Dendronephthya gigantea]|uniref:glutathione hydrolase 1 proenzyme-like n=1 Tax=Dendronephthya gigantea TaxID=151771 RepID=UPI00106B2121|nr:glutathione hydrolase 1 proenzyme-like [Dendronephthya gigantea]XP_028396635.1 glutathione hydrolase 1 proenzyme-like [Dendronephthya gigantea]
MGSQRVKIVALVIVVVVVIIVAVTCAVVLTQSSDSTTSRKSTGIQGAVASDSEVCSNIGADVMRENGTAIDAAIATLICLGLIHPHSSGIGGGGYMLLYKRSTKKATYLDFRETAPGASTSDMFVNKTDESKKGKLSVAVPGEILAMYGAWKTQGRLPWKRLFQPTIDLAENGFKIDEPLAIVIKSTMKDIIKEKGFKEIYFNDDGQPRSEGETIKDPIFAKTLKELSEDPFSFYNGTIAKEMVKDIQDRGGILTMDDLKNFTATNRRVLSSFVNEDTLYTTSATSSGSTLIMILNILKGFKFTADSISPSNVILTWHRIIEALKFGYAYRPYLGDPEFYPEVEKSIDLQINATYAEELRQKISNDTTYNTSYYGGFYANPQDSGTTHLSVVGPTGDAVSVTSTLGYYFGAKIRSYKTGIVYNNHMSTFSLPNIAKVYQPKSSKANYIEPGKRSVSTACPTIVVDKNGIVRMVVGGSGGLRITSGVPQVIMNKLWFGLSLNDSIDRPRLHHQLHPNKVYYEKTSPFDVSSTIIDGLRALGHEVTGWTKYCAIQGVYRDDLGNLFAKSDPRKTGVAVVL